MQLYRNLSINRKIIEKEAETQILGQLNIYQEDQISELYMYILSIQKMRQSPTNRNE